MSQHDDDDQGPPHPEKGGETWLMTFADMMSLLMSFFVLLLSFSEQDSAKFKEVGGSLEQAFGVQRELKAYDVPRGTSIIANDFGPGKPETTIDNEIRQSTVRDLEAFLEQYLMQNGANKKPTKEAIDRLRKDANEVKTPTVKTTDKNELKSIFQGKYKDPKQEEIKNQEKKQEDVVKKLEGLLKKEVDNGKVEVFRNKDIVIIRILEQGNFTSGDDRLQPAFIPVLKDIASVIEKYSGEIIITGHTDNVPIHNARFRSNWELSTARAVSVLHFLEEETHIEGHRMFVTGFADTKPIKENDTTENKAHNRRVEIILAPAGDPLIETEENRLLDGNNKKVTAPSVTPPAPTHINNLLNYPIKPLL